MRHTRSSLLLMMVVVAFCLRAIRSEDELTSNRRQLLAFLKSAAERSKRGCDINLPGFGCDDRTMIHSANDAGWWSSVNTPGKKRRFCINADGSSCDTRQIMEEYSNRMPWMNGPGRRKRSTDE